MPEPTTQVSCSFEIAAEISAAMPTVGVVEWSTDLAGLSAARIEFTLDDPERSESNVGSGGPIPRDSSPALLLGLKPDRSYTYRIMAISGEEFCVSEGQSLRTEPDPDAPVFTRVLGESDAPRARGFIVTCNGTRAMIIDSDGTVVWWTDVPTGCSRAHMDWDGEFLWTVNGNPGPSDSGGVMRVKMDGSGAEEVPGLERTHHDFAVLPDGTIAFLVWSHQSDEASELVERAPDGTLTIVTTLGSETLNALGARYHANALRYSARDDSYTVSDLGLAGITKLNRRGELEWQARRGCSGPRVVPCADAEMGGNHGHQLLEDGNLLFFAARQRGVPSPVYEYSFTAGQFLLYATLEWSYESDSGSENFGDVQRLSNGNTLVTYSWDGTQGVFHEVSPARELLRTLTGSPVGYATFRETLYGPPQ